MNAAELLLKGLEAQGVQTIYGVPGEENEDVMLALQYSTIEFVTCRHEQNAAFMADMEGRLTGRPGVCLSTLGPGATNMITGVANANMDRVPLIAIVGQAATTRLHKDSHQNMDAVSMYQPVTKWATTIRDADVVSEVVEKAFKQSMVGKPGAVMIELPEDIAAETTAAQPLPYFAYEHLAGAVTSQLEQALALIADSVNPLILLGSRGADDDCHASLKAFVGYTKIYTAATFMGKGGLSARDPRSLFCVGLGMKDIALEAFDAADLVICIGYSMIEWHPDRWNQGHPKRIIHIDVAPSDVDKHYLPEVELVGRISNIITALNEQLTHEHQKAPNGFSAIRERIENDIHSYDQDKAFPIKPQRILHDLREALADDDILISDVGAHKMWVARQYPAYKANTCFIYNGFCSMGGALPAAFTAKRLNPEQTVVALCGDGGFVMSMQALVTAARYKVPLIALVWEDHFYGLIKWKQESHHQMHSHVDLVNPDLVALAEGLGCDAKRVNDVEDLKPTLQTAQSALDRPYVVIVPVDYTENMKLSDHLGEIVSH